MPKEFGFVVYESKDLEKILPKLGYETRDKYVLRGNKTVKCNCCGKAITKTNLGNILPGSDILYCDNPVCFAEYAHIHFNY